MFVKLEVVSVKHEPESDSDDGHTEAATETPLFTHHVVKEELDLGTKQLQPPDVSQAAALDANHVVKKELVLGPELLQPPNTFNLEVSVKKEEDSPSIDDLQITAEKPVNSSSSIDNLTAESNIKCDKCGKDFNVKSSLEKNTLSKIVTYKSSKEAIFCAQCSETESSQNVNSEARTAEDYVCKNNLGKKTLRHKKPTNDKPFKCSQCNSAFTHSKSLRRHERTHVVGKTYKCSQCSAAFIQSSSLRDHLRTHTGEKPYKCNQCESAFAQSSTLNAHIKTHSGEKPFKCSQCNSGFTTSRSLQVHIRTHTGEKPFKCNLCSSTFTQSGLLQAHLRTHTGEKPFKCNVCDYRTTQSSHLKSHVMSRHSGQKPYGCDACSYRGATKNHLRQHVKKFH